VKTVVVSSKYQVTIPWSIRESMGIEPGQNMHVTIHDGHIVLVPGRDMKSMRGFVTGMDSTLVRDEDRY
jgi:AbrB family looped-hinge helix DNA binding protein